MKRSRDRATGFLASLWSRRECLLVLALGLWLAGYWLTDGWHHRRALWLVMVPAALNLGELARTVRHSRWLWAVGLLLAWQVVSRLWTRQPPGPAGSPADALPVFVLLAALVATGRREHAAPRMVAGLALLSTTVALISLAGFYGWGGHSFADDRLRNPLVYAEGLNPILTGMLFGFGATGAAWFSRHHDRPTRRAWWLAALAILAFGLMATQSRAPMLAGAVSFGTLLVFEARRLWRAALAAAASVALYLACLMCAGSEAAGDLVERGSTGRLSIYRWFLADMRPRDFAIGKGIGSPSEIPEEVLGWFVHHPHSSYLTQFYLTGAVGLLLLGLVLAGAGSASWQLARRREALWPALLAGGCAAVLFDGAQVFSLHSVPRIEFLLVAVPAAMTVGRLDRRRLAGHPEACPN